MSDYNSQPRTPSWIEVSKSSVSKKGVKSLFPFKTELQKKGCCLHLCNCSVIKVFTQDVRDQGSSSTQCKELQTHIFHLPRECPTRHAECYSVWGCSPVAVIPVSQKEFRFHWDRKKEQLGVWLYSLLIGALTWKDEVLVSNHYSNLSLIFNSFRLCFSISCPQPETLSG